MRYTLIILALFTSAITLAQDVNEDSNTDSVSRSFGFFGAYAPVYSFEGMSQVEDGIVGTRLTQDVKYVFGIQTDKYASLRVAYEYHSIGLDYDLIATVDEKISERAFNSTALHAFVFEMGKPQYVPLSFVKNNPKTAFRITPWVGFRAAYVPTTSRKDLVIGDTTISGFDAASYSAPTDSGINELVLQRLSYPNRMAFNISISLSFEVRMLQMLYIGVQPFYSQGISKLYNQQVTYQLKTENLHATESISSVGSHYGVLFSLRAMLFK